MSTDMSQPATVQHLCNALSAIDEMVKKNVSERLKHLEREIVEIKCFNDNMFSGRRNDYSYNILRCDGVSLYSAYDYNYIDSYILGESIDTVNTSILMYIYLYENSKAVSNPPSIKDFNTSINVLKSINDIKTIGDDFKVTDTGADLKTSLDIDTTFYKKIKEILFIAYLLKINVCLEKKTEHYICCFNYSKNVERRPLCIDVDNRVIHWLISEKRVLDKSTTIFTSDLKNSNIPNNIKDRIHSFDFNSNDISNIQNLMNEIGRTIKELIDKDTSISYARATYQNSNAYRLYATLMYYINRMKYNIHRVYINIV